MVDSSPDSSDPRSGLDSPPDSPEPRSDEAPRQGAAPQTTEAPAALGGAAVGGALARARRLIDAADASPWRIRAVFVLVCALAATFWYARSLGAHYAVRDWLFWRIFALWGYGALLGLGCLGLGAQVVSRLPALRKQPVLEQLVMSAAAGLVGFVLAMYAGGALALYNATFAIVLPVVMALSGALPLRDLARRALAERAAHAAPENALTVLAGGFGVVCVAVVYLQVMTPETINFDASWSHIPIAADYARAGKIIPFPGDYTRNFPHLPSIVHTWAFLVPGLSESQRWMMLLHNEFFFLLWTLAGVAAAARYMLGDTPVRRAWVAFFLFPAIFVYDSNLGGAADHYLAFFTPPLFLACARAAPRFELGHCLMIGVAAAGALLSKYQASYVIFGAGLLAGGAFVYHAARRALGRAGESTPSWRALLVGSAVAIGGLILFSSPHFLRNWIFYNNPLYPFSQDVFTASTPTTPNADFLFEYLFKDWNWRPHGTFLERLTTSLALTFSFSFKAHYSFVKNFPITGSLFTLGLPLLLVARRTTRIWAGVLVSMGALFLWAFTFRVDRHLQAMMPLLAAVTAATLVRVWDLGWIARAGLIPLVGLQIVWGGDAMFYSGHARLKSAIDLIRGGYEGKRAERFVYRKTFKDIERAIPEDAFVILHNYRPNLGINRKLVLDWAGQQGLILYEGLKTPRELYDYWRSLGVTHVLHIPNRRPAPSKAEDVLFAAFERRHAKVTRVHGWEVLALPKEPPPEEPPYQVLAIGVSGYRDGLYPVEAMKTYDALPRHLRKYPAPAEPLPKGSAGAALAEKADAVLVGKGARPDAAIQEVIGKSFSTAASYKKAFTLHLRRDPGTRSAAQPAGRAAEEAPPPVVEPGEGGEDGGDDDSGPQEP